MPKGADTLKERTFWDGLAMGAAAGVLLGLALFGSRRDMPMMHKRRMMEKTARAAWRRAQGTFSQMAGRFSG